MRRAVLGLAPAVLSAAAAAAPGPDPARQIAARPVAASVAGDPSCNMTTVPLRAGGAGAQVATGTLQDQAGTLVRDGVAAMRLAGKPGLVMVDARWTDPARTTGPDIEILRCESGAADAAVPPRRPGRAAASAQAVEVDGMIAAAAPRPRRLDRSYDRNVAEAGAPGRSRAALMLADQGDYIVLVGGAPAGTAFTAEISSGNDDRPALRPLEKPTTRGSVDADSTRQHASLRPYVLHDLKIDADGPVLFRGTATGPLFLEVGDVSDDAAFDWFGLRRAGTTGNADGEIERLMLWRTRMEPGTESAFGLNLKQGSYLVRLRGVTPNSFGDYTVTITTPQGTDLLRIPDPEAVKLGVTRGTLVIGESFSQDADGAPQFRPTKLYQFKAKAGSGYEVRLESESPELDPFVGAGGMLSVLSTPRGKSQRTASGERFFALLANNDHPNVAGMTKSTDSCLFFVPQKDGPIVLKVIGTRPNQAGSFVLSVREQPAGCRSAPKE
ncbi:hypothetical protein [Polymorphobacter fuscus]|uniref:Peptidase C-terminal archaeal/bacterial domain-containing protein n=1 Tax=Sandarakinorhabdus fusca TaxID=1439888 RepID=A0A7C9GQJ8_9SPHN|nr:hypothetical protein [Polymorphobacter fuscus]KAB7646492.1 hypothetical protein F9290_10740 [Polymorphobacter fuscus]MQT17736.1 hypothetical protein [Polymorphobacter fuscus]NJC09716.1 hypothetical protein [Polymorphobacter fuscus]